MMLAPFRTLTQTLQRTLSTTTKVSFGHSQLPGYAVGSKGAPAVIVLQEWWGINESILKKAEFLAENNFRCIVPDLYKGEVGVTVEEAQHNMENLDFPAAVEEVRQCAQHLIEEGSHRVGVVGFCMGGALSWLSAAQVEELSAAVPLYGIPAADFDASISIPVQAHHGEEDNLEGFSDPATARALEARLKARGTDCEFFFYDKVGHGFLNDAPEPFATFEERKAAMGFPAFDEGEAKIAWGRILGFLEAQLKS